ncbi:MAG: galactose-1-phosphate uridylyltransferase [Gemmatimonadetes bacterium]|nr:galactose-1-phosphate uridylyltransferase [Gemmatimonadota bacterium]|tara:strand:- start:4755 stop:6899 length:2145 start_codon:yes stop_codon:yes gene_type:complete
MRDAVLVTGGAGYVGSHISLKLLEAGRKVVILDNLSTGHVEVVRLFERLFGPEQFTFEEADLLDADGVALVFGQHTLDGIIDFAARSLVGESQERSWDYFDTNVVGFQNLVQHAGNLPIVKSSTAATYGNPLPADLPLAESYQDDVVDQGRFDESQLMPSAADFETLVRRFGEVVADLGYSVTDRDERKLMIPTNVYGITKMMDELILQKRSDAAGAGCACLRYFNVAGADSSGLIGEDHDPETHLVPIVLRVALGLEGEVTILGEDYPTRDGTAIRDYVSVGELADAHIRCLDVLRVKPDPITLNLGTRNGHSVREIIDSAERVTGRKIASRIGPRRSGDPAMLVALTDSAARFGWEAKEDLDSTIDLAWQWYRHHPEGYSELREDRYNPFVGRWVTMSAGRAGRPWSGSVEDRSETAEPSFDAECYLCPGNVRANGEANPDYASTYVFENDFPSLTENQSVTIGCASPYRVRPAAGRCEVLVYSPDHSKRMATMDVHEIASIIDLWADTYDRLSEDFAYVLIFENRGGVMGNSQLHPHGQVYAYRSMPDRMITGQIERFSSEDFVSAALIFEEEDGRRIVWRDEHFVAFVPFAAVMPYDVIIVPRRSVGSITACSGDEKKSLAQLLKQLLGGLDGLFDEPYHYSLALLQAPTDGSCPEFHLQIHLTSLLRGPGLRKHVVGSDIFGRSINPSDPAISAAEIRQAVRRAIRTDS